MKLDVKEYNNFVLKNVVMKQHHGIALNQTYEKFNAFVDQTNMFNVQTFGPLVTINRETTVDHNGTLLTDCELLAQAHDYEAYQDDFIIKESIEFPKCIALTFKGPKEHIHYAHSKLELFCHENNLKTTGEIITVLVNQMKHHIEVDLLKPVL